MTDTSEGFDPALFRPDAISAETAAMNAQIEQTMASLPPLYTLPPQQTRDARESGESAFGPLYVSEMAEVRTIPDPHGEVPVRVFMPETVKGIYLRIHGGGWVIGRAHHADEDCEVIARECSVAVISIDYRLAPEHPYPAGNDDCESVALWLAEHARSEFGSDRMVIGGESAGAHLSVTTLLRMRDKHGYTGFRGANLVYGCYDLSKTPSAANWGDRPLILNTPAIDWFVNHYVPEARRRDPDVSPLYADLRDLPPALFTIGTLDPLVDDSLFMHARWLVAGNDSELAIYPGGAHGFNAFPMELAHQANARMRTFIDRTLS